MSFLTNNFIADIFEWILVQMHNFIPSYVVVVLLASLIIHVALSPLDMKQKKSALRMSALQPKLAEIKKRYPDPQAQTAKIQELYRKENVKMTAGCLPMIVKLILIIAFFGAITKIANQQIALLVEQMALADGAAVELPGILWVKNIWQPDSGGALVMPTLEGWERIAGSLNNAEGILANIEAAGGYETVIAGTLEQYSGVGNGWYILPIMQGVLMYFSMSVSLQASDSMEGNPMSGPMMKIIMSAVMAWVCLSSNTLFTLYFIFSNLTTTGINLIFNRYYKSKEAKEKKDQIFAGD